MTEAKPGRQIVVASNNRHKLQEMQSILGSPWLVLGAREVAPNLTWDETGGTFLENARIKINALRPHVSGCILADDSGLCVDALKGAPGVHSSSYGGVEGDHQRNVERLLAAMDDIPDGKRGAHFYCLILFLNERGNEEIYEGRCYGQISRKPTGDNGFGYDPVFIPDGFNVSMAQLSEDDKNAISHRGRAMSAFMAARAN